MYGKYDNYPNTEKISPCFLPKITKSLLYDKRKYTSLVCYHFNFKYIILLHKHFLLIELCLFINCQIHIKHGY